MAAAGWSRWQRDGNPAMLAATIAGNNQTSRTGVFNIPTGAEVPAELPPDGDAAYEFSFRAAIGDYLSLITMLVESNDLFFAPQDSGIDLFPAGEPIAGDITDRIFLWDAGTEVNEMPGSGANQARRQESANSGEDENGIVQRVADDAEYPPVARLIRVTISAGQQ